MASAITIPTADEIAQRIRECRAELTALKRLHRLAITARQAEEARYRGPVRLAQAATGEGAARA